MHATAPTATAKMGRPEIFDALKQQSFLRLIGVGFSTRRAAKVIGVSPSTVREKVRTNSAFACGYEDAKASAIPTLTENIFQAAQKSWRASAWLLERLCPDQFGRRVALGPDPAKRRDEKRREKEQEQKERERLKVGNVDYDTFRRCMYILIRDRRGQQIFNECADDYERDHPLPPRPTPPTPPAEPPKATEQPSASVPTPETPAPSLQTPTTDHQQPTTPQPPTTDHGQRTTDEPTSCPPPPSANKSAPSAAPQNAQPQPHHDPAPLDIAPNAPTFCALTPTKFPRTPQPPTTDHGQRTTDHEQRTTDHEQRTTDNMQSTFCALTPHQTPAMQCSGNFPTTLPDSALSLPRPFH